MIKSLFVTFLVLLNFAFATVVSAAVSDKADGAYVPAVSGGPAIVGAHHGGDDDDDDDDDDDEDDHDD